MPPTLLANIMKELEKGGMSYSPHPFIMIHHEYIYDEYIMWGNAIIQGTRPFTPKEKMLKHWYTVNQQMFARD